MKKAKNEELSKDQLEEKIKSGTYILYIFLVLLIVYGVFMFYQMLEGTWETGVQIVIPFFLFVAMMPIWMNIKNMKDELQKRNQE